MPTAPIGVRVFSRVVVWGPPEQSNGIITGYQLRFTDSNPQTTADPVNKEPSESYHVGTDDNIRNLVDNIQVQVCLVFY